MSPPPPDSTPTRPRRRSLLWRSRRAFYAVAVLAVVAGGGMWMVLNSIDLPPARQPIETTFVCDSAVADGQCGFGNSLASLASSEDRVLVDYQQLPPVLVQAVLSAEDKNFFDHGGIDPMGIGRALLQDFFGNSESKQGGSTITQQYVKTVYLSPDRTFNRKLRKAVLTVKLEKELDKREILTRYLNQIYFGRGAYGVEAASRTYFGVGVGDLQLYQAAYLAGLIRSPETADASKDPNQANFRRRVVLEGMVRDHYISAQQAKEAEAIAWNSSPTAADGSPRIVTIRPRVAKEANFGNVQHADIGSEYWLDMVRSQLRRRYGPSAETRGLRVYTTFDPRLQNAAQSAVTSVLNTPDAPLGSLVAVDKQGQVRAMVGGTDYAADKVNLALGQQGGGSGRQAGSTFKPLALASFIEKGYSTRSRFDAPPTTSFPGVYGDGGLWKPANDDYADHGVLTAEEAMWYSVNTVYAGMVDKIGPDSLVEVAGRLGVRAPLAPNYSLVLGTEEVSVLDMASAYSTFADRGLHVDPYVIRRIEDSSGNVLFDVGQEGPPQQVVAPEVADTVTSVLRGVMTNNGATGTSAYFGVPAAGKTGTTENNTDSWFTGYTCNMTASVWMGYRDPKPMVYKGRTVFGGTYPAQIWKKFMQEATKGDKPCTFPRTDAGTKILNSNKLPSSQATTTAPPTSSTTTVPGGSTTTVPGGSTTTAPGATTVPKATTTTAPPGPTTAPAAPATSAPAAPAPPP